MFAKLASSLVLVSALAVGVSAKPLPVSRDLAVRGGSYSFNGWGGFSSMDNFDNFFGSENFCGSVSTQTVVTETEQESVVVCHSQSIEIIQQRLLVLQEMAKRIITEQICEVETQTIVFQQFTSSFSSFHADLSRSSGNQVGFDSNIAGNFGNIVGSDGSLTTNDLGFSGHDLGSSTVVPSGSNWNSNTSPASVGSAFNAAQSAIDGSH